jgi:mannose-1-phosphate guanylyltransferase
MKFIITAGGQGKKLWPYSRKSSPKQFQKLIGDKSLFQINIEALLKGYSATDIFISTKKQYFKIASSQAPHVPQKNFILEPDIQKDRGPAEGLAFLKLSLSHPGEPFMIVQADSLRIPNKAFLRMISTMEGLVKRDKKYITGGIKALNPVMGNDYLEIGDRVETKSNIEIYKAVRFLGRSSDYGKTKKIIEDFHAVLHSNHSCWYPELMLEAYKKYKPGWYESLMKIKKLTGTKNEAIGIDRIYSEMEKGSTEEVTRHVMPEGYVALLPFKWTDIGTWGSYYDFFTKNGGVCGGDRVIPIDSRKSLVKTKDPKKLVVLYNIDNLMVIDSGDTLLVLPREDEGRVNTIVDELEKRGLEDFI